MYFDVITQQIGNFLCILSWFTRFFGVNFILQKFCSCKKMTNMRYELAKVGWLLRGRWVEKYPGSLEMQLLPRLPVTGRGTSLHQLTHYQVINLDSCWTCPSWLPRKWLHFKSAHCSGLPLNDLNWKHFVISYFYIYTTICIYNYSYRFPHSIQCDRSLKWCRARCWKQSGTRLRLGGSADKAILAA